MMSAISTSVYVIIKSYTTTFYIPANCIYFSLIMNSLIWLKSGTDRFIFILYVSSSMYREKIIFLQLWKKTTTGKLVTIIKKLWIIFFKNILIPFYISPPDRIFNQENVMCIFSFAFFLQTFFWCSCLYSQFSTSILLCIYVYVSHTWSYTYLYLFCIVHG